MTDRGADRLHGRSPPPAGPPAPSPAAGPDVSVVLGSYQRADMLRRAIHSVRDNGFAGTLETIVVDGGSTDGSIEWLVRQKDVVTIVQHNRGSFRGRPVRRRSWGYFMNLGFKAAQGRWVLMISDDCLLVPGALAAGVAHVERLAAEGRRVGAGAFYFRNWPEERRYYVQRTLGGKLFVNHGLYRREALHDVGFADEETYVFYKADGDLCLRMWQLGWEVADCPDSFVEHHEEAHPGVRATNQGAVLDHDRRAYLERWRGVYWFPDRPDPRGRLERDFADGHRTAERFVQPPPPDEAA